MNRRSLLKRLGATTLVGGLAGCSGGGSTSTNTDSRSSTTSTRASSPTVTATRTTTTEEPFDGRWGLPACSDNEDARVIIRNYNPELGVGQVYNRTTTNLFVSIRNEAGSTAKDNQGSYDVYVPFGESGAFRLGGPIESVVTMTERKYSRRSTVDWLYRHNTQENEACVLPEGETPSSIQITPKEEDKTRERLKDSVRDAAKNADLVGDIQEVKKTTTGIRVRFSIEAGSNAPESVPYTISILTRSGESYPQSGEISVEPDSTVSEEVLVEFSEFDADMEYGVVLVLNNLSEDFVVIE